MKRTIIILSTVLTLCVAGILYGNHLQTDQKETTTLEEAYATQLPAQMPEMVVAPMPCFSLY